MMQETMTAPLLARIAQALAANQRGAATRSLIEETKEAVAIAQDAAAVAQARSTDHSISAAEARDRRHAAEDAQHEAGRLAKALADLVARAEADREAEAADEALKQYLDLKAATESHGRLIQSRAPKLIEELAALIAKGAELREAVVRQNRRLPPDCGPLCSPFGIGENFPDYEAALMPVAEARMTLLNSILPDLRDPSRAAWPPIDGFNLSRLGKKVHASEALGIWRSANRT